MADKRIELKANGIVQSFDFAHAVRLLRLEAKTSVSNWKIHTKGYTFKDNEISRNKKTS